MTHWQTGMRLTPARLGESETGQISVSFTGTSNTTHTVTFAQPFAGIPRVTCEIVSAAAVTAQFEARPINITTTGFGLWVVITDLARTSQTWAGVPVDWRAER
ncbi:H-type lectin domain-containing protein [Micromonospora zamorensis]|uniref:H-type lectin domain-containing protein n=1 Tax=Micromonospora zamorensis TaxID=709883 RepID=UPI003866CB50|nr:H-type lectin domain-containing protein [Micromonospora zamorensis]